MMMMLTTAVERKLIIVLCGQVLEICDKIAHLPGFVNMDGTAKKL